MKKWYYSATNKGLLLILAHICIVVSTICFVWVAQAAGLRYLIPFEKVPEHYEETYNFSEHMKSISKQVLSQLQTQDKFETNGKYDPEKLIDVSRYSSDNLEQDGINHTGIAYRLQDLEQWSEIYINAYNGTQSQEEFEEKYVTTVIVCLKEDGSYYYYYGNDFQKAMKNGEIEFTTNGEYISKEEKLNRLLTQTDGTESFGEIVDKNHKKIYTDCWNLGCGNEVLKEPYPLDGAKNLVDLANTDPKWNGKLKDAYHELSVTLSTLYNDVKNYREAPSEWEEGNTNYSYILVDYDRGQIFSNRQEFKDISEIESYTAAMKKNGAYVIVTPKLAGFESTFSNASEEAQSWKNEVIGSYDRIDEDTNYVFMASVDTDYPVPDTFKGEQNYYKGIVSYVDIASEVAWGCLILFFSLIIWITIISGHSNKNGDDGIVLTGFDHWKTEIAAVFVIGLWALSLYFCQTWIERYVSAYEYYYYESAWQSGSDLPIYYMMMIGIVVFISCLFFFWFYLSFIRRVKAKTLWSNSLAKRISDVLKEAWKHKSASVKIMVLYVMFLIIQFFVWGSTPFIMIGIVINVTAGLLLLKYVSSRQKIKKGLSEIAKGNVNFKIPLDGLSGETLEIAQTINRLGEGLNRALEKSVRDERLKTDLITNVSHDIKTPLTSIINYVDILKRENFQDPKIRNYLDILEMKAQRLKTLTEDVVEASKVSSGNIKLEMMELNLIELIYQVEGEYEEKFEARDLKVILNMPDEPAVVRIDGRRMWRVFANVFNNAAKYAMEGSRVYGDLILQPGTVKFILKNVSEQQLNISADELTERFIRGDVSRSTEGSGLGLSIAKNLTELQGGTFELYLDGDLFKVIITFPRIRRLIKESEKKKSTKQETEEKNKGSVS
mgnify:CR=1 FL=1|nr:HAMP domain-containing sensor histidine kinase [uncultured Sellimonas sp.]